MQVEDVHPPFTPDDCFEAESIVKADETIKELLETRYGITDMDKVACDPWSGGQSQRQSSSQEKTSPIRLPTVENCQKQQTSRISIL